MVTGRGQFLCHAVQDTQGVSCAARDLARHSTLVGQPGGDSAGRREKGTCLAARYKRLTARRGPLRALVAVEHSITTEIWHTPLPTTAPIGTRRQLSRRLGLAFRTVRRFARADAANELLAGAVHRPSKLDEYKPYLTRRWNEGCRNGARLHEEIQADGWNGAARTVQRYVNTFRGHATVEPAPSPPLKPRRLTTWIMTHPDHLDPDAAVRLKAALEECPELRALVRHVRDFAQMMTHREGHRLDEWIAAATAEELPDLCSFARGLRHDHSAVTAGLTLAHSSGAVEGTVNKIKMLKRQMFGRANLDLLRIRVLHAL